MSTSSFPLCGSRGGRFRPWLTTLVVSLVALLAVGCGSSRDEFVFTGTSGVNTTGSMTFNFVQAQEVQPSVVPVGTTRLLFEFFDGPDQTGAKTLADVSRDFANTITIDGVPTSTSSVRVTAFTSEGVPLLVFTANVVVIPGTNVVVALGQGTAVVPQSVVINPTSATIVVGNQQQFTATLTFSNGTVLANQTSLTDLVWSASEVLPQVDDFEDFFFELDQTGLCTAKAAGQGSITCSYFDVVSTPVLVVVIPQSDLTDLVGILLSSDPDPASVLLGETITFGVIGVFESDDGEFEEPLAPGSGVFFLQDVNDDADDFLEFDGFTATTTALGSGTVRCGVNVNGTDVLSNPVPVLCGELGLQLAVPTDGSTVNLPNNNFVYGVLVEETHPNPEFNRILSLTELLDLEVQCVFSNDACQQFGGDDDQDYFRFVTAETGGASETCVIQFFDTRGDAPSLFGEFDVNVGPHNMSSPTVLLDGQDRTDPEAPLTVGVGQSFILSIIATINGVPVDLSTAYSIQRGGSILEFEHCEFSKVDPRVGNALSETPLFEPPAPPRVTWICPGRVLSQTMTTLPPPSSWWSPRSRNQLFSAR